MVNIFRLIWTESFSYDFSISRCHYCESFSNHCALLILLTSPKLCPIIRIVSNVPSLELMRVIGIRDVFFNPRSLQTLIAKGEMSIPSTSYPCCCRYRECLPVPHPISNTRPTACLIASFSCSVHCKYSSKYRDIPKLSVRMYPSSRSTIS